MQQKVQFIGTLLHDPDLVILDEPFSGLDRSTRSRTPWSSCGGAARR
jgi:ABC-type uncharacterized transport system ATPase subunit